MNNTANVTMKSYIYSKATTLTSKLKYISWRRELVYKSRKRTINTYCYLQ